MCGGGGGGRVHCIMVAIVLLRNKFECNEHPENDFYHKLVYTVIHFYFDGELISVIRYKHVLPKFNLYLNFATAGCGGASPTYSQPPPKFFPYRNGEFSLCRKLYATEIKVDYSKSHGICAIFQLFGAAFIRGRLICRVCKTHKNRSWTCFF